MYLCLIASLAACGRDATAAMPKEQGQSQAKEVRRTQSTGDNDPAMVVLSVRHHISGIHYAHVVTNATTVKVQIRWVGLTSGFQDIGAGTLATSMTAQNGEDLLFTTTAGRKYMVVAIPVDGSTELPDQSSTFEFTT